jgi:large subunit ribosomal protein L30
MPAEGKKLKVTLVRSTNHRSKHHQAILEALGLRKLHKTVTRPDNPAVRGMLGKLSYLLKVEEA